MRIRSVNVAAGLHHGEEWTGTEGRTGIDKRPVQRRVRVFGDHLDGDRVINREHHGGPWKAVHAYAYEDAQWWSSQLDKPLWDGAFGENLTTEEIDVTDARIGEQWRIGSAVLSVVQPRIPCRVFAGFWDRPGLVKEFAEAGRPGAYLSIIEPGEIGAGDGIEVIHRPPHDVTLGMVFAARIGDQALVPLIADAGPFLPPTLQEWLGNQLR